MATTAARGVRAWLARQSAPILLAVTAAGMAAGGVAWLAGGGGPADMAWLATAACGLAYAWPPASATVGSAWM